jgi:transposase
MSKHSTFFKQHVVEFYGGGERSYEDVARQFGLDYSMVRRWVAVHAVHGVAGLSKKHSHYDAAFKLSVLQRMWKDGLSRRQTAAVFDIRSVGCLSDWERRYEVGGLDALEPRRRGRRPPMPEPPDEADEADVSLQSDKAKSREDLLAQINYLRMENAYLKKLEALTQARHAPKGRKPFRR